MAATGKTAKSKDCKVEVAVRVRPALPREVEGGVFNSCVGCFQNKIYLTTTDKPVLVQRDGSVSGDVRSFAFDSVFDQKAETREVFDGCCKSAVDDALHGLNATIFAYGQTGTGKTFTMSGEREAPGIIPLAVEYLFSQDECELKVAASYVQIYQKRITDLLAPSSSQLTNLTLRERRGVVMVDNLTKHDVASREDLLRLLARGTKQRATAATKLNSSSSRSHAVLTLYITTWRGEDDAAEVSKLNLVDLAGSERVKDSGVSGADMRDARNINLSLFHLIRVVDAILKKQPRVPYQDDKLTFLLKDALGGNCRTIVVATVSPAQLHARESEGTLRFALACSHVKNKAQVNVQAVNRRALAEKPKKKKKVPKPVVPWKGVRAGEAACPGSMITIATGKGNICARAYGDPAHPLVICLHGHPSSSAAYGQWLMPGLVHSGFYAVAIDMPGRGGSVGGDMINGGEALKTRSEYNLEKGGAADVVAAVIIALGARRATLIGYDWGAGIALSMAHAKQYRKLVERVVSFHPSYNEKTRDELKSVGCPVQIIWCKEDQFHAWSKWKVNAKKLKGVLGSKYDEFIFSERAYGTYSWSRHEEEIERRIITFITGVDPIVQPKEVFERPEESDVTTGGTSVTRRDNVVIAANAASMDRGIFEKGNPEREAVAMFAAAWEAGSLDLTSLSFSQGTLNMFARLPELSPTVLADPQYLVDIGLWDAIPSGWQAMRRTPRYFPGRRVLARAPVCPNPLDPAFMLLDERTTEDYTTHRAVLRTCGADDDTWAVDVGVAGGGRQRMPVPRRQVLSLNQRHILPTLNNEMKLEDGIRLKFSSGLAKAKMCDIALSLKALVSQLDFDDPSTCEDIQRACVVQIRRCLGIVTFQRHASGEVHAPGGRSRDVHRYCKDDAAKFAFYGQGHCHTVSSVMAAFLAPWQDALGLDLKYRGGFSFGDMSPVRDDPERHQWLEFTTRPSMRSFVCDLYLEDGLRGGSDDLLNWPVESAYQRAMYPNGKLPKFSELPVTTAALEECDIAAVRDSSITPGADTLLDEFDVLTTDDDDVALPLEFTLVAEDGSMPLSEEELAAAGCATPDSIGSLLEFVLTPSAEAPARQGGFPAA